MGFNELKSVGHYIIHQLTGMNLNGDEAGEPQQSYGGQWTYKAPEEISRGVNAVLIESKLKEALVCLNSRKKA